MPILQSTTIVAALLLLDPGSRALDCALQAGADWSSSPDAVSAISCAGASGFFVPSPLYRELRDPTKSHPYRLIDEELTLTKRIVDELKTLDAIREQQIREARSDAEMYRRRYLESLDQVSEANQRAIDASIPHWYSSPLLWFVIGIAATTTAVILLDRD